MIFSSIAGTLPMLFTQKAFAEGATTINSLTSQGWTTAAAQTSQTVLPSDLSSTGWYYYDDNADTPSTTNTPGVHEIAANPVPSTGDNGAVKLDGGNGARNNIATNQYANTNLHDIAKIGFSTYQPSSNAGGTSNSPFMNFNVDLGTGLQGYQGRLVYVPETNANPSPTQSTWQNYEGVASNGHWNWSKFVSNGNKWPDGNTTEDRSWNDIVSAFPNAKITNQLLVRAGEPYAYNFSAYIDHVYLATVASNVNYNFELATPPEAPTNLSWVGSNGKSTTNGFTNIQKGTLSWQDTSTDVNHYVYKFWTNIAGYYNGPSNAWTTDSSQYITKNTNGGSIWTDFANKEGTYSFCVEAVDAAGKTSACSATYSVTYDSTAPTGIATYNGGNKVGDVIYLKTINDLKYTLNLFDNFNLEHTSYAVWKADSSFGNRTLFCGNWNGAITSVPVSGESATLTGNVKACSPTGDWSNGNYVLMHVVYDAAGNLTYFGGTYPGQKFTIDKTAPVATITAPTSTLLHGKVVVNGTVNDVNPDHYYFVVKNSLGIVVAGPGTVNQAVVSSWNWDTTLVPDDMYTIALEARDKAGNKDASSVATMSVTVNNTIPSLSTPLTVTNVPTTVANAGNINGNGTANAGNARSLAATANTPQVLGATTTEPVTTGQVKGAETTTPNIAKLTTTNASTTKSTNFLGLGWWWLVVVGALIGLGLLFSRFLNTNKKA